MIVVIIGGNTIFYLPAVHGVFACIQRRQGDRLFYFYRLRPKLMTAQGAIVALAPLALK